MTRTVEIRQQQCRLLRRTLSARSGDRLGEASVMTKAARIGLATVVGDGGGSGKGGERERERRLSGWRRCGGKGATMMSLKEMMELLMMMMKKVKEIRVEGDGGGSGEGEERGGDLGGEDVVVEKRGRR